MKSRSLVLFATLGLVVLAVVAISLRGDSSDGASDGTSVSGRTAAAQATGRAPEPTSAAVSAPATKPAPDSVSPAATGPATAEGELPIAGHGALPSVDAAQERVEVDPDYEAAMREARIGSRGWKTDFSRHTVPYSDIVSGGVPRDGIPPLDIPMFDSTADAETWLEGHEPVIAFEMDGDARAYPLQVLTWHEIVNDKVGGVPVTVTFCPLCNSAIVFDRRLDGVIHDFGTSGKLRNSDLIMWDRQTESWWQQLTGEGIVGELAGKRLTFLPAAIVSFSDFRDASPDGKVLSRDTGYDRPYGRNPYSGYDRADNPPFLFDGDSDGRLQPKERVAAATIGDVDVAFPFSVLEQERAVNYTVDGQDVVVFFKSGTASALDASSISESRDVGATGLFSAEVDGRKLTFQSDGARFVDNETGSVWNILGHATEGALAGTRLTPIVHGNHFWFAWGAFKPDTLIYQGMG